VDGTGTWGYQDFQFASNEYRGRPVIWVAEDKHANYKTQNQCDLGANWTDNCDHPLSGYQTVEVRSSDNIGDFANYMLDCVASRDPNRGDYDPNRRECYTTWGNYFAGWRQIDSRGAGGPYSRDLRL
jgi:hypothetical protein